MLVEVKAPKGTYCGPLVLAAMTGEDIKNVEDEVIKLRYRLYPDNDRADKLCRSVIAKAGVKTMLSSEIIELVGIKTGMRRGQYTDHDKSVSIGSFVRTAPKNTLYLINSNSHFLTAFDGKILDTYSDGKLVDAADHPWAGVPLEFTWSFVKKNLGWNVPLESGLVAALCRDLGKLLCVRSLRDLI